jgi:hypothetical protein
MRLTDPNERLTAMLNHGTRAILDILTKDFWESFEGKGRKDATGLREVSRWLNKISRNLGCEHVFKKRFYCAVILGD